MLEYRISTSEVERYLLENCNEHTKIYLGCDSERFLIKDKCYADYALCIVIHINGCNGAKVFGEIHREQVFDRNPKRPQVRLMNEVIKLAEFFLKFEDALTGYDVEIHLDLNPSEKHKSNVIVQEALGYIKAMTRIDPKIKPHAWAASACADRYKSIVGVA